MSSSKLIERTDAAEYLGVSPGTLANWQSTGFRKVPHIKIGKRVKYRISDLDLFIESNLINSLIVDEG